MQNTPQLRDHRQRGCRLFTQPLLQVIGNGAKILIPR